MWLGDEDGTRHGCFRTCTRLRLWRIVTSRDWGRGDRGGGQSLDAKVCQEAGLAMYECTSPYEKVMYIACECRPRPPGIPSPDDRSSRGKVAGPIAASAPSD